MTPTLATLAALAAICYPLRCEWSAPGFVPASSSAEVWALPCPPHVATAPAAEGDYPVTLTIRCATRPTVLSTATRIVPVLSRWLRDGFETGDLSRWNWRHP